MKMWIGVAVRPLRLDLSGVEEHVHEGAEVVLSCQVTGARPAANITWYNGSEPIGPQATADTHAAVQVSHSNQTFSSFPNGYHAKTQNPLKSHFIFCRGLQEALKIDLA